VANLKYMEMTVTNQNGIHEEIKSSWSLGILATSGSESFVFLSLIQTGKD
jgi:hypothetical protein